MARFGALAFSTGLQPAPRAMPPHKLHPVALPGPARLAVTRSPVNRRADEAWAGRSPNCPIRGDRCCPCGPDASRTTCKSWRALQVPAEAGSPCHHCGAQSLWEFDRVVGGPRGAARRMLWSPHGPAATRPVRCLLRSCEPRRSSTLSARPPPGGLTRVLPIGGSMRRMLAACEPIAVRTLTGPVQRRPVHVGWGFLLAPVYRRPCSSTTGAML